MPHARRAPVLGTRPEQSHRDDDRIPDQPHQHEHREQVDPKSIVSNSYRVRRMVKREIRGEIPQ